MYSLNSVYIGFFQIFRFHTTPCSTYRGILCPADVELFLWHLPSSRFLECNTQRAAGFHDMFPGNKNEWDPRLRNAITDMKEIMYRHRAMFWLFCGTLLGTCTFPTILDVTVICTLSLSGFRFCFNRIYEMNQFYFQ